MDNEKNSAYRKSHQNNKEAHIMITVFISAMVTSS